MSHLTCDKTAICLCLVFIDGYIIMSRCAEHQYSTSCPGAVYNAALPTLIPISNEHKLFMCIDSLLPANRYRRHINLL